jgi:hypothetical protein
VFEIMPESAGALIGIRATGTHATSDYDQVLIPKLTELPRQFEALSAVFYMDQDFKGWDLLAAWANTKPASSLPVGMGSARGALPAPKPSALACKAARRLAAQTVQETSAPEEAVLAVDQHLRAAAVGGDLSGAFVGRGFGDLLVGGVSEELAVVLDGPAPGMAQDRQDRAFGVSSHHLC